MSSHAGQSFVPAAFIRPRIVWLGTLPQRNSLKRGFWLSGVVTDPFPLIFNLYRVKQTVVYISSGIILRITTESVYCIIILLKGTIWC